MATPPGPHPDPPDLSQTPLPLVALSRRWLRGHRAEHGPVYFGRTGDNRFDAPGADYGVLYLAADEEAAFVETFGHGQAGRPRLLMLEALRVRRRSAIDFPRPLRLVDLTGSGLARMGADGRLCTGAYTVSQAWSQAFFAHPDAPDGLYYRARHDPGRFCAAVFERAAAGVVATDLGSLADPPHRLLLAALLDRYAFGLAGP